MGMKYYKHLDPGYYSNYFGVVGPPVEVPYGEYYSLKCAGYLVTAASSDLSIEEVHVRAQIDAGSHPNSYRIEQLREHYRKEREND